jgi:hypothetical protein
MPISPYSEKNNLIPYLVAFSLFLAQKNHFRIGRAKNVEKRLLYLVVKILPYRYCTTKTNVGQKWHQSTADGFLLFRWTYFFKFKGPCPFKLNKTFFSVLINFVVE